MATATERLAALTSAVNDTNTKLDKAKAEIVGAVDTVSTELASLREQIANGTVTEDSLAAAEAAVATLQEKATGLDDLNVDPENPEGTPAPETPETDGFGNPLR